MEQTRRIANVRIQVERVIGNICKKFSILGATQPIDFVTFGNGEVTTPDKIVTSCCALVNLCESVVPFERTLIESTLTCETLYSNEVLLVLHNQVKKGI